MKTKKAIKLLDALAQENRLAIFRLLVQEGPEGLSAGTIAEILQLSPATLSFHLSQLENAGAVRSSKAGRHILYAARYKVIKKLMHYLGENSFKEQQKAIRIQQSEGESEIKEQGHE